MGRSYPHLSREQHAIPKSSVAAVTFAANRGMNDRELARLF